MRLKLLLPAMAALVLGACNDDPELATNDDGRSASGEVLEGTISDAMIATDELRSQPPLLEAAENTGGTDTGGGADANTPAATSDAADETESASEPQPEAAE